jgi:hypothetical protein
LPNCFSSAVLFEPSYPHRYSHLSRYSLPEPVNFSVFPTQHSQGEFPCSIIHMNCVNRKNTIRLFY